MIIRLNIVMSYPVHWGRYNLFRDFIQNFYDAIGYEQFKNLFQYEYDNRSLKMKVDGVTFSYEWLLHIGASTKTSSSSENAGYFGEGFKIASLCGFRDFGWKIKMSSADWELDVISEKQRIDGNEIEMLAYDVKKIARQNQSCLTLYPIDENDFNLFKSVIDSFYYPENPLFGEKLWESREGAVYTRSQNEYDRKLPCTYKFGRKGAVFCAYQLLGSNPFDLVVCQHNYNKQDRERKELYSFYVVDVFENIAYHIDAYGAMRMLEKMRRYWGSIPQKRIDIDSWYPVINILISRIAFSQEVKDEFRKKYDNLLCIKPARSIRDKNRRGQAKSWLKQQTKKYLLVQGNFTKLGYNTLEEECAKYGGFVCDDLPSETERKYFNVLEEMMEKLYSGFFIYYDGVEPMKKIIFNEKSSYHGMAKVYPLRKKLINNTGLAIRYTIGEIYLKRNTLKYERFYDAVSTYVHEMCHMFGGDASNNFSLALTFAMEILLMNSTVVEEFKEKWIAVER